MVDIAANLSAVLGSPALVLAKGLMLVSWYKPLLAVLTLGGWAWVVSSVYDKDAARWYLPRQFWNVVHLTAGFAALAALFAPVSFWIAWAVMIGVLGADLIAYFVYHNADKRVPDTFKWNFNLAALKARAEERKAAKEARLISFIFKGPAGPLPAPDRESPEYEVRIWAEELVEGLITARGSQMDIAPSKENHYGVTFMVDGVRQPVEQFHQNKAVAVVDFFKKAAGLDVQDRRRRQVGDFQVGKTGAPLVPCRLTTMGSSKGIVFTLILQPEQQVSRRIDDLGLHPNQLEDLKKLIEEGKGAVLLAAPADNGRTQTMYALLRKHDAYTSNVQTIELEQQATIEGVRQNKFEPTGDAEFSTTVRSILRRDPDVVAVAEMPDEATAREVAKADHERTRIYVSLRADGVLPAIQLFARAVGDQKLASNCLHGAIGQRLVRQLCVNCKAPFQPTAEMIKKLGLPKDTKQLFKKSGQVLMKDKPQVCPVCGGSGFFGQIGVFEVYTIGPDERKLIAANDMTALRAAFRQRKQQSLQQAALQHVVLGNTSVEEVIRVTQSSQQPAAKPSSAAAKPAATARPSAPTG